MLQSLRAGVVPRRGQHLVQVGRSQEVSALISDIARIADGGAAFRLVIGEYGAGKTFFLHLVRLIALQKRLVTVHADLAPDRRLHATGGQARSLYSELMRNAATRSKPDGGAIAGVVERFVSSALQEARESETTPQSAIRSRLDALSDFTGGYAFAEVVAAYWRGHDSGDEQIKSDAIRWLRGEFATKTDARAALGVRTIVTDASVYDHLKLMALFVRQAGYHGLLVCLDEMVNLYKLAHTGARKANYEQILRVLNDCLQGTPEGLGFVLGGTPEFLMDPRKGLYSYEALQTRLAVNTFAGDGVVDFTGPVISLGGLTPEDLYLLLTKIRHVHAAGDEEKYLLPDDGLRAFMRHCSERIGDSYFRTPRSTVKQFADLLAVLDQNPGMTWESQVSRVEIAEERNPDLAPIEDDDEATDSGGPDDDGLASFRL